MYDEDNKISGILNFGYEVTEQVIAKKQNLQTQEKRSKELEEKVALRTHELQIANNQLEKKYEEYLNTWQTQCPKKYVQRIPQAGSTTSVKNGLSILV